MSPRQRPRTVRLCAIAAGLVTSGIALADAQLDPQLVSRLAAALPADELQIVVGYRQSTPVSTARFALEQGPFELQPTLKAYFDPNVAVTRAAYAVAAGRYLTTYQSVAQ